ncbi:MAG TPA: HEAT repeat domain-containing protein [Candidatus Acidoferrales bacterium]|nr:HEAT repeat domain-containing protein [Candidatus Acidoferrales bacterium]
MKRPLMFVLFFLLSLSHTARSSAQTANPSNGGQPRVVNAKLETRAVQGPLESDFRALVARTPGPAWIAYAVPEVPGDRTMCCGMYSDGMAYGCGRCRRESGSDNGISISSSDSHRVNLEGGSRISILFRVRDSAVERIRVFSEDCELDAGGLPLTWLTGVRPAESVALLAGYVTGTNADDRDARRRMHGAIAAIALHADAGALESLAAPGHPDELRKQVAFWLGEARGKAGLAVLKTMAHSDPSDTVRAHVPFALSVSREPGAVDEMIRMAREDSSAHVRGQALFWLAQKAGKKAAGAITDAIENDPNTEVKKKAVFALSQMPKDDGVPKLIEVARNNRNPAVRKQAMFWLGQSNDPRALQFFEEILSH